MSHPPSLSQSYTSTFIALSKQSNQILSQVFMAKFLRQKCDIANDEQSLPIRLDMWYVSAGTVQCEKMKNNLLSLGISLCEYTTYCLVLKCYNNLGWHFHTSKQLCNLTKWMLTTVHSLQMFAKVKIKKSNFYQHDI